MVGTSGVRGKMTGYTECAIDVELAQTVWELIDAIEHMSKPPKAIGICVEPEEDGKYTVGFKPYNDGDEHKDETMVAAMAVDPSEDDGIKLDDDDLRKAMQFMYFYQAVYSQTQKYELDM